MANKYRLSFVARSRGKDLSNEQVTGAVIAPLKEGTIQRVPFTVHGTGCFPVMVTAELGVPGKPPVSRTERTIPFQCHE
jgi:hypothetical protein